MLRWKKLVLKIKESPHIQHEPKESSEPFDARKRKKKIRNVFLLSWVEFDYWSEEEPTQSKSVIQSKSKFGFFESLKDFFLLLLQSISSPANFFGVIRFLCRVQWTSFNQSAWIDNFCFKFRRTFDSKFWKPPSWNNSKHIEWMRGRDSFSFLTNWDTCKANGHACGH